MNQCLWKPGVGILALALLCAAGLFAAPALARSWALSSEAPSANWLVTNTSDDRRACTAEACSLGAAIIAANASAGDDVILFNLSESDPNYDPVDKNWVITLNSALPALSDGGTTINGHSQPIPHPTLNTSQALSGISDCGQPRILINAAAANYGFEITASDIMLIGFEVYGAQISGIYIHGSTAVDGQVLCNYIIDNGGDGIAIADGAARNVVGDNLISGNSSDGVEISQSHENSLGGNFIGVDVSGLSAWPNSGYGVNINSGAISNTVMAPWDGLSVISGNALAGVRIQGDASRGNLVNNVIIGAGSDSETPIGNQDGVILYNTEQNEITNNLIGGNSRDGVVVYGGMDNSIMSNQIGVNARWENLGNARYGVLLESESSNSLLSENSISYNGYLGDYPGHGGVAIRSSSSRNILYQNIISHNAGDGVLITGESTSRNFLDENSIYSNSLEGINLESGANANLAAPEIQTYVVYKSIVFLTATATECPNCVYQVFSDNGGEGRYYEGTGVVSPVGEIQWFSKPQGTTFTLTVTDAQGNTSEFSAAPVFLDLSIDDALPHVTVNKLIGDTKGEAGNTIVEAAAKITSYDPSMTSHFTLTLTVPGAVLGTPIRVFYRDTISDLDGTEITSYTYPSSGTYVLENLELNSVITNPTSDHAVYSYERLIVFRFEMPASMTANSKLILTSSLEAGARVMMRSDDWARINAAKQVDGILITNRSLLYENNYRNNDDNETTLLLQTVFTTAQGPPSESRAPTLAVYYVDQYSTAAQAWDNTALDYADESTANQVAVLVDELIRDWFEDATTAYTETPCISTVITDTVPTNVDFTIVILGDDDVIPYYRSKDPVDDNLYEVEDDSTDFDDQVLLNLTTNNYFFTDNLYADLYQGVCSYSRSWDKGGVEARIGRIVGGSPADMETLINSGLDGPQLDSTDGAIVAGYDGFDSDTIQTTMNAYPLNVFTGFLVDDDSWRLAHLMSYMAESNGWVSFSHSGHANNYAWCTPGSEEDCLGLGASEINDSGIIKIIANFHPVVASTGCRSGIALATGWWLSPIYGWARAGASSIMASTGLAYGNQTEGISVYGEELLQQYWYNLLLLKPYQVSTGLALKLNKANFDKGVFWDGFEKKTVREFTLFGLPWVGFYTPASAPTQGLANLRTILPPQKLAWPISAPAETDSHTYVVTVTVDASQYTVFQEEGFDLVQVEGMQLDFSDDGPVLPYAGLMLPLPLGSTVQEIQVTAQNAFDLGTLQIPLFSPAYPMLGGPDDVYSETPDSYGIYPSQLYSSDVTSVEGSQVAHVTIFPLVYDAVSNQATLYQALTVRITYQVPTPVGLLGFYAQPAQAALGDALHVLVTLLNASDEDVEAAAVLKLTNSLGDEVDNYPIPPFIIPAGSQEYALELDWTPTAAEGSYQLELEVWRGSDAHVHAQQPVAFVAGRLSGLIVTPQMLPDQATSFEITFQNLSDEPFRGQVQYTIYNFTGSRVIELETLLMLSPHQQVTVATLWNAMGLPPGIYSVAALVSNQSETATYGPLQEKFKLPYYSFLPLMRR